MDEAEIRYTISKRLPKIFGRAFSIPTDYGEIELNREQSEKVVSLIEQLLNEELKQIEEGEA